jgi:hypothetical protein
MAKTTTIITCLYSIIFSCLFSHICMGQELEKNHSTDYKHEVSGGVGIGSSSPLTAPSANIGYAYWLRNYSAKFTYHSVKQIALWGKNEDPDKLYDLSLILRRSFAYKKFKAIIGAGVSSLRIHVATSSIIPSALGTFEKTFTGFVSDVDLDFETKNPKTHLGLNIHGSFNRYINFIDTDFYLAIRF